MMFKPSNNKIIQLIYKSNLSDQVSQVDLLNLVNTAQQYNHEHEISGFLLSDERHVIQLIEGSPEAIKSLFDKIVHDVRHSGINKLYEEKTTIRTMPFLGMGLCFLNSTLTLPYDFFYTKSQARELSGLISGHVGKFFRQYLV
jgi:Sensors of blue-light using FAD